MKKTLSFATLHFSIAFCISYLLTGELLIASLIALIEPIVNTFAFYLHDLAWKRFPQHLHLKTTTFSIVHFSVAFSVGFLLSGELITGWTLAAIEPTINSVVYFFHEKRWLNQKSLARKSV
ncbi:MAG: DUF2061 domain-containing protein [Enterovibrio sp.]